MRRGFTLIEVALALMVVGVGLLAVFQLFPAGLRAGFDATAETRAAQFADMVFNGMRARAADTANPLNWSNVIGFRGQIVSEFAPYTIVDTGPDWADHVELAYPHGSDEFIRYTLDVRFEKPGLAAATLVVRYGKVGTAEHVFYSAFYNMGAMP
jgi:prepilin-type N-terminal cleavage/methylation domain-containing protein